jgi:hypothetical protein
VERRRRERRGLRRRRLLRHRSLTPGLARLRDTHRAVRRGAGGAGAPPLRTLQRAAARRARPWRRHARPPRAAACRRAPPRRATLALARLPRCSSAGAAATPDRSLPARRAARAAARRSASSTARRQLPRSNAALPAAAAPSLSLSAGSGSGFAAAAGPRRADKSLALLASVRSLPAPAGKARSQGSSAAAAGRLQRPPQSSGATHTSLLFFSSGYKRRKYIHLGPVRLDYGYL